MDSIRIVGAKEHNLKNINLEIPHGNFIVFSGISGSGKSSLVYDTIYQEGRRRFIESLSAYARQFLGKRERPKVETMEGLSPSIAIDQKTAGRSNRSTVGTITEIYDHLRLLFARLGEPHCPYCGIPIQSQSPEQIVDFLLANYEDHQAVLLAPIVKGRKGEYRKELKQLARDGFGRVRIDGEFYELPFQGTLARYETHTIEVVMDRVPIHPNRRSRLYEGIFHACQLTNGLVTILLEDQKELYFSTHFACPEHGTTIDELEPRIFSFNNPQGACPTCKGAGFIETISPEKLIKEELSIKEGAIPLSERGRLAFTKYGIRELRKLARSWGFSLDQPWKTIPVEIQEKILYGDPYGTGSSWVWYKAPSSIFRRQKPGIIPILETLYRSGGGWHLKKYFEQHVCQDCKGTRLKKGALSVLFRGKNIAQYAEMTILELYDFFQNLKLETYEAKIGSTLLYHLREKLEFLVDVGLDYLTLDRRASTLSGGEAQRIRLASQIGSGLQGVLYVLDEPTIGLHPRDNQMLLNTIKKLRDKGNTLLVVEHDTETMAQADLLVEIGPGAGKDGGFLVAKGTPKEVAKVKNSPTGLYLSGKERIEIPKTRRKPKSYLKIKKANIYNLQDLDVNIPLGLFTVITGVSGSGKSTLVEKVLREGLEALKNGEKPPYCKSIQGEKKIEKIIDIDQSPIGRTPRS
ncbi:MAG: excinuclease ABC subunit A, partial [Planctomycetota bacterium]